MSALLQPKLFKIPHKAHSTQYWEIGKYAIVAIDVPAILGAFDLCNGKHHHTAAGGLIINIIISMFTDVLCIGTI